jgi:hypothetical protein
LNEVAPIVNVDEQLEAIAKDIEALQASALMRIAERLAAAHKLHRHNRDEGGFEGWVEKRLTMSRKTAYRLLDVHKQFGGYESVSQWHTLPRSVLYLLAAPSTPEVAREEAIERIEAGERLTLAEVRVQVEAAQETARSEAREQIERLTRARDDAAREVEERLRQENLVVSPEELEAKVSEAMAPFEEQIAGLKESVKRYKQRLKQAEEKLEGGKVLDPKEADGGKAKVLDPDQMQADAAVRNSLRQLADDIGQIQPETMIAYARRIAPIINRSVPQFLGDTPAHAQAVAAWATRFLELTKGET